MDSDNLQKLLVELNKIAIAEGIEDIEKIRQDSTVVETNIHYPTNNSILWDCITEAYRLLGHLREELNGLNYQDYSIVPRDCATDGGYASLANQAHAKELGITNIVFNKIVGSLQNIANSKNTDIRKQSFGTHELTLAVKFGESARRYRWLNGL